jgi:hypothetical protein
VASQSASSDPISQQPSSEAWVADGRRGGHSGCRARMEGRLVDLDADPDEVHQVDELGEVEVALHLAADLRMGGGDERRGVSGGEGLPGR